MSDRPLISVVMPAFNVEAFIAESIASILAQDHRPLEVIVVDDGSTDGTTAVAASFGDVVRVHRQANSGAPMARNRGVDLATADLITFLDADDVFEPDMIARQLPRLWNNPGVDIVLGRMRHFEGANVGHAPQGSASRQDEHIALQLSCGLFRRSVFETVGRFEVTLQHCDDWDWFMRARELNVRMLLHQDVVVNHRLHGANITRDRKATQLYQAMMFKRSLERRRARAGAAEALPPLIGFMELHSPGNMQCDD